VDCCAGAAPALHLRGCRSLLLILGPIVIFRTPTDIFPNIDIPVVSILWNYAGLNAQDLSAGS
jgi:multidrug efflux pump subunit AcrB